MATAHCTVVKVGGSLLETDRTRDAVLDAVAAIAGSCILVHGGGGLASTWSARMGIPVRRVQGRRITDAATLEMVTMVYGGLVNRGLVAELQARGRNALGMTGADADCIRAARRPAGDIDYGYVGDIQVVRKESFSALLSAGFLPVVAPLTHDGRGQLLNTNADTVAAAIAAAMTQITRTQLVICLDSAGVLDTDGATLSRIDTAQAAALEQEGTVRDGMLPKLAAAFDARRAGVSRTVLCRGTDLAAAAAGADGNWTELAA
ncbi:MAG: acetylglutamate kinase [Bacteroidota bacterium]|nr:acetylglutamate kinase [Bacteroidota bacterium]